jgi:ribonuclease P protein component
MRFRAEQHLRRQLDIQHVRQAGRRFDCGGFMLWWARRSAPLALGAASSAAKAIRGPRVAVIASRAAVGGAVQRNRAKRRLREVFRHHQQAVPPEVDLLLVARSSLNRLEYGAIERKFISACATLFPSPIRDT